MAREKHKRRKPRGESTEAEHWGGPIVTSHQAMAQRSVEGISHQTVAHGVQAGQPRLTNTFAADRESSFMKAGYGKTVRPVCAAGGGKLSIGRLLRPDSDEGPVMGLERRDRVRRSYGRNNWKQEDAGSYDRQTVQYYEEASVRGLQSGQIQCGLGRRGSSSLIQTCGAISTSFGTE